VTYLLPIPILNNIVKIIRRQYPEFTANEESLHMLDQDIYDLLHAVGASVDDSEYFRAFREAVDGAPSSHKKAETFHKIAIAANSLDPEICPSFALAEMEVVFKRQGALGTDQPRLNRRHHLIGVMWSELTDKERQELRAVALELEAKERSKIQPGAPEKSTHNALLIGLADIYLRAINDWTTKPLDLPHEVGSRFIQFAHAAASQFFPEVSLKALSRRWDKWKQSQSRKARPFRPIRRQIRRRPNKLK